MAASIGGNLMDGSGAATGASQVVFTQNISRQYLLIQNHGAADMWVNFGTAAVAGQPSIKIPTMTAREWSAGGTGVVPTGEVTLIGTAAQTFTAKQA